MDEEEGRERGGGLVWFVLLGPQQRREEGKERGGKVWYSLVYWGLSRGWGRSRGKRRKRKEGEKGGGEGVVFSPSVPLMQCKVTACSCRAHTICSLICYLLAMPAEPLLKLNLDNDLDIIA